MHTFTPFDPRHHFHSFISTKGDAENNSSVAPIPIRYNYPPSSDRFPITFSACLHHLISATVFTPSFPANVMLKRIHPLSLPLFITSTPPCPTDFPSSFGACLCHLISATVFPQTLIIPTSLFLSVCELIQSSLYFNNDSTCLVLLFFLASFNLRLAAGPDPCRGSYPKFRLEPQFSKHSIKARLQKSSLIHISHTVLMLQIYVQAEHVLNDFVTVSASGSLIIKIYIFARMGKGSSRLFSAIIKFLNYHFLHSHPPFSQSKKERKGFWELALSHVVFQTAESIGKYML